MFELNYFQVRSGANFVDYRHNDKFIIIDDDKSLNSLPSYLKNKLIQTSGSVGLTSELAEEALSKIEKLNFEFDSK